MAHVQFRTGTACTREDRIAEIIVDGVDITDSVLAEGFKIEPSHPDDPDAEWCIRLALAAETFDVDMPNAVLDVIRAQDAS